MIRLNIKPLSVNEAWQGHRFKTKKYINFEKHLLLILPKLEVPKDTKLQISFKFGLSSKNADADNCIKQSQDIISKKYKFNDRFIYRWDIEKIDVKKGHEFIEFEIQKYYI